MADSPSDRCKFAARERWLGYPKMTRAERDERSEWRCPACNHLVDTPMHELGCEKGGTDQRKRSADPASLKRAAEGQWRADSGCEGQPPGEPGCDEKIAYWNRRWYEACEQLQEARELIRRAAPFVNAVAVQADDKTPALAWLADASLANDEEQA